MNEINNAQIVLCMAYVCRCVSSCILTQHVRSPAAWRILSTQNGSTQNAETHVFDEHIHQIWIQYDMHVFNTFSKLNIARIGDIWSAIRVRIL